MTSKPPTLITNISPLLFYILTTAPSLTLTLQSPPRLIGWSHPLIGHWGGRRAIWQRSQQSLGQVRCLACGFQRRSPLARSACCFPRGDQGSGDLWLQCLKIPMGHCMYSTEKHTIRLLRNSKCSTFTLMDCEMMTKRMMYPWPFYLRKHSGAEKHIFIFNII